MGRMLKLFRSIRVNWMDMVVLEEAYADLLLDCPLFKGLAPEELGALLSPSSARIRSFGKNELVAQAGDEIAFMHVLLSGQVKGEMIDYTGKVIKIEDIEPPRPLAPAFLFGKHNRYPVNITAGTKVEILSIPRNEFLEMMQ